MKIAVFAYNFPHKKTQDTIWTLQSLGYKIDVIFAADPVKLDIPKAALRVKPRHIVNIHPRQIAENFGVKYLVSNHNDDILMREVEDNGIELGVIGGARILKQPAIEAFKYGILNAHPGIIPQVRGLDALQWALYNDNPLGVTVHLIDQRVDAGRIVIQEQIGLFPDDTLIDLSLRLYEKQFDLFPKAIELCRNNPMESFPLVGKGKYNKKMSPELEAQIPAILEKRLNLNYSQTIDDFLQVSNL